MRHLNTQLNAAHAENHRLILAARDLNERITLQANANIQHQQVEVELQQKVQQLQNQLICMTATNSNQDTLQSTQALQASLTQCS